MKTGDIVRLRDHYGFTWSEVGVVIRDVPGWAKYKVVHWSKSGVSTHVSSDLRVVSAAERKAAESQTHNTSIK